MDTVPVSGVRRSCCSWCVRQVNGHDNGDAQVSVLVFSLTVTVTVSVIVTVSVNVTVSVTVSVPVPVTITVSMFVTVIIPYPLPLNSWSQVRYCDYDTIRYVRIVRLLSRMIVRF